MFHKRGGAADEGDGHDDHRGGDQHVNPNVELVHVQELHPFLERRLEPHPDRQSEHRTAQDLSPSDNDYVN